MSGLLLQLMLICLYLCVSVSGTAERQRKCQEITIPMCRGIPYNLTSYPNRFNHDTQEEAGLEVHQFWPLVEINCSPDLRFFLCSMYAPICMPNYPRSLPVCRSVCQRAKVGCAPLMRQYGFSWPERMNCDDLPVFGDRELCMEDNVTGGPPPKPPQKLPPTPLPPRGGGHPQPPDVGGDEHLSCGCAQCRSPLVEVHNKSSPYFNLTISGVKGCAMNCDGAFYGGPSERWFVQVWLSVWAITCCVSSLLTLFTFFVDTRRFPYPERPVVCISACYLMVSIAYIIRLVAGHDNVVCDVIDSDGLGSRVLRNTASESVLCTLIFLLLYYFGMASSLWWVMLAFTWFLSAALKWGQEAIAACGHYFHIVAWIIPAIKCVIILVTSLVDADPVAGVCYVGHRNSFALKVFVVIPLCVYLVIGLVFLIAGFVALFRIRKALQQQVGVRRAEKLDRLMVRVGVFAFLYTVPALTLIACYLYEHQLRDAWEQSLVCQCPSTSSSAAALQQHLPLLPLAASTEVLQQQTCRQCIGDATPAQPVFAVFMLKYVMTLLVGISAGFWVCTAKTVSSWRRCCQGAGGVGDERGGSTTGGGHGTKKVTSTGSQAQQRLLKAPTPPKLAALPLQTHTGSYCHSTAS